MKPGVYHIRFSGGYSQNFGDGIGVITESTINGGDVGYFWSGLYQVTDGRLSAKIHVKRWKQNVPNPLADLAEYDLILEGEAPGDWANFSAQGYIEQYPSTRVIVNGVRLGDAV